MTETQSPEISVVLAERATEEHIVRVLRSIEGAARATTRRYEIITIDDFSEDQTVALIRNRFPQVRLIVNPEPWGRARTLNRGVEQARAPVVVLVEGAVTVPVEMFRLLTAPFFATDETQAPLMAVGACALSRGEDAVGAAPEAPRWGRGGVFAVERKSEAVEPAVFVRLAVGAVDRARFLQLGGFESLYQSGGWQDRDLTFRATRAGWRCLCVPSPMAEQWRGLGSGDDATDQIRPRTRERSRLWFNWLNLHGFRLLVRHLFGLASAILLGTGDMGVTRRSIVGAFVPALLWPGRMRRARKYRKRQDPEERVSERELLGIAGSRRKKKSEPGEDAP